MNKSSRQNLTIRMHPKLKELLQIQAIRERRDLSDLIEDATKTYLHQMGILVPTPPDPSDLTQVRS